MVNVNRCKWVKCQGLAKAKDCKSKWFAKANGQNVKYWQKAAKAEYSKSKWLYDSTHSLS